MNWSICDLFCNQKRKQNEHQELDREHIYKFDAAGLLLSEDGEYKMAYIKDNDGKLIQEELHPKNGSIQEIKYTNTFDEFGIWITRESVYRYVYSDGKKDQ